MAGPEMFAFIVSNDPNGFKKAPIQTFIRQHASRKGCKARRANYTLRKHNLGQLPPDIPTRSVHPNPAIDLEEARVLMRSIITEPLPSESTANEDKEPDLDRNRQPYSGNPTTPNFAQQSSTDVETTPTPLTASDLSICQLGRNWSDLAQACPIKLDLPTQRVFQRLLDSPSNGFRGYRDAWLPAVLPDAAAFQQFLSLFTLHLQNLTCSRSSELNASELNVIKLRLHSNSLNSINRRMLGPNVSGDEGLLATVISFVAYYQENGRYDMWQMHIKGLKRIISIQGGLERAFANKPKLRWILFCVNLHGSWLHELPAIFPPPYDILPQLNDLPAHPSITSKLYNATQTAKVWRATFPQQPLIPDILNDLVTITAHLTAEAARTAGVSWTDSVSTGLLVNPLVYRLYELRIRSNSKQQQQAPQHHTASRDRGTILQEIFRIAALMYLRRTKWHSVFMTGPIQLMVARLKDALCDAAQAQAQNHEDDHDNDDFLWKGGFEPLKCWILFIGAIYAREHSADRIWFAKEILGSMVKRRRQQQPRQEQETVGVGAEQDLSAMLDIVKSFLWFEDLFGEAAEDLLRQLRMLS